MGRCGRWLGGVGGIWKVVGGGWGQMVCDWGWVVGVAERWEVAGEVCAVAGEG